MVTIKNEQLQMFLISDGTNFSDIILDTLKKAYTTSKKEQFEGNVFGLIVTKNFVILNNLLDTSIRDVVISTKKMMTLITKINNT